MTGEYVKEGIGRAIISPDRVIAGQKATWVLRYIVGDLYILPGGIIRIEFPYGFTMPQWFDPRQPGYTTITSNRSEVKLSPTYEIQQVNGLPPAKMFRGRHLFLHLTSGVLEKHDEVIVVYGHPMMPSGMSSTQTFAGRAEFSIAVYDGINPAPNTGYWCIHNPPVVTVLAGPAASLEVTLPTDAAVGEEIVASVVSLDEFQNVATDYQGLVEIGSSSATLRLPICRFSEKDKGVLRFPLRVNSPGKLTVAAQDHRTGLKGRSNVMEVHLEGSGERIFWGDIHNHTILGDGLGMPDEIYTFAREASRLDFCAITEHAQYLSDEDWEEIKKATRTHYQPGSFVTMLGYEFSHNPKENAYGDKCFYFPGENAPLIRERTLFDGEYIDLEEIAPILKEHGAMGILHQHAGHSKSFYDPELIRNVEIFSIWGCSEYHAHPLRFLRPGLVDYDGNYKPQPKEVDYVIDLLNEGYILGFIASSDGHGGHPGKDNWLRARTGHFGGLVAVFARELTREGIWEALYNRHCYATTGARIRLQFTADRHRMGEVLPLDIFRGKRAFLEFTVEVCGTGLLHRIDVVKNGQLFYTYETCTQAERISITDSILGPSYYYVRVLQTDGHMAWSSPIWIK